MNVRPLVHAKHLFLMFCQFFSIILRCSAPGPSDRGWGPHQHLGKRPWRLLARFRGFQFPDLLTVAAVMGRNVEFHLIG